jgi:hypothetical protein
MSDQCKHEIVERATFYECVKCHSAFPSDPTKCEHDFTGCSCEKCGEYTCKALRAELAKARREIEYQDGCKQQVLDALNQTREECERLRTKLITEDDKLCGINARLRAALEWYADRQVYYCTNGGCQTLIDSDLGQRARAALKVEE